MAANRQTDRHTHAHAQCSHASVGLAQARPNYITETYHTLEGDSNYGTELKCQYLVFYNL